MKDKRKTIAYKQKRKYVHNLKIMEDILEAKVSKQNNLGTDQSGVGVQITTSHKKYNNEPVARNSLCTWGSKNHMRRSSKLCSQQHVKRPSLETSKEYNLLLNSLL